MLTQEELKKYLHYDPETGVFTWRGYNYATGARAGCVQQDGYRSIQIKGKQYKAHRLAWLYEFGEWPDNQIDHINLVKDDNRWENLREGSHGENQQNTPKPVNNSSGIKGVRFINGRKKWRVSVKKDKRRYGGQHEDLLSAVAEMFRLRRQLHGEFAHYG